MTGWIITAVIIWFAASPLLGIAVGRCIPPTRDDRGEGDCCEGDIINHRGGF